MNFQTLATIEKADTYLDHAFKQAKASVSHTKQSFQGKTLRRDQKSRFIELEKVKAFSRSLTKNLQHILVSFPSIDGLDPFYNALVKCTLDYDILKKSLGAVNWAQERITQLEEESLSKLRLAKTFEMINSHSRAAYGRMASVVKQIKKNLEALETARGIMKKYPSIKTSLPTIVIAGFPNTGKTTLLKALTTSAPKIAPYPFTTQRLMIGYAEINKKNVQFIDTPGLLDRPFLKRNTIEKQAVFAIKYLAKKIIFVVDPTESCGYTLDEQRRLLDDITQEFSAPILIILNKKDLASPEALAAAQKKFGDALAISAEKEKGIAELISTLKKDLNTA